MVVSAFIGDMPKIILIKMKNNINILRLYNINRYIYVIWAIHFAFLFTGCDNSQNGKGQKFTDTQKEGTIYISVDESFKPIIDSQIQVFESQHPLAHIIASYKSEADCFKDLDKDSTRMIIVTRGLTDKEDDYFQKKLLLKPKYGKLAYDAIALIMNKKTKDSLFSVDEIKKILEGTSNKYKMILDGLNATSTVRYALDSILRGTSMSANVQAAKNSESVINYVESDPQSVGLVGVSWLGKKEDAEQLTFSDKVRIAAILCNNCEGKQAYVYPYQANIATARYPMIRGLYYILKENGTGLGSGFLNFLTSPQKGQLIFKRAYLLPARLSYDIRKMSVEEEK